MKCPLPYAALFVSFAAVGVAEESRQVMIDAKFVETRSSFTQRMGIDWGMTLQSHTPLDNGFGNGFGLGAFATMDLRNNLSAGAEISFHSLTYDAITYINIGCPDYPNMQPVEESVHLTVMPVLGTVEYTMPLRDRLHLQILSERSRLRFIGGAGLMLLDSSKGSVHTTSGLAFQGKAEVEVPLLKNVFGTAGLGMLFSNAKAEDDRLDELLVFVSVRIVNDTYE